MILIMQIDASVKTDSSYCKYVAKTRRVLTLHKERFEKMWSAGITCSLKQELIPADLRCPPEQ